jgi:RNA polymerase sigma-70 factor (ECF subfamily)
MSSRTVSNPASLERGSVVLRICDRVPLLNGVTPAIRSTCWVLVEFSLVERAQCGDDLAFHHLVMAYRRRIVAIIGRIIRRPEDVEDVAQEVCMRIYYSLDQLKTAELFEVWLYRLAVNASYDYLRKRRRRHESRMSDLSEQQILMAEASAGNVASGEERRLERVKELVDSLLQSVSEHDRILLIQKEIEDLTVRQLAKLYSVDEAAVKVRLFRARQRALKMYKAAQSGLRPGERNSNKL